MTTQLQNSQNSSPQKSRVSFIVKSSGQSKMNISKIKFMEISKNLIQNQIGIDSNYIQNDEPFSKKKQHIEQSLSSDQNIQNNPKIQNLIKKLHTSFIHYKIPQFYAFFFLNQLVYAKQEKIQDSIQKQIKMLKQKSSNYHKILNCINARQSCLKQLSKCLENLFNNTQEEEPYKTFRQQIEHYRTLTVLVIKNIKTWKQYTDNLTQKNTEEFVTFVYKDEDYLIKLLNDNMFIFNSFLSTYVRFSQKNDPFIIRPFIQAKQTKYSSIFSVTQSQKQQFIYYLQYLAQQRAKYLKKKVTFKEDRIKQTQRIYQTKNDLNSSQIFMRKINSSKKINLKPQVKQIDFVQKQLAQNISTKKSNQFNDKNERMRRIKSLFSRNPLINKNKFQSLKKPTDTFISSMNQSSTSQNYNTFNSKISEKRVNRSPGSDYNLSSTQFRKDIQKQYGTDFGKMMRQKELQILHEGNKRRSGSFRSLKLKDSLSDRQTLNNKSTLNELQAIVTNLQNTSPMKLEDFKKKQQNQKQEQFEGNVLNSISSKKLKKINPSQNMIKHNEEVIMLIRNQIMKQITMEKQEKQKLEVLKKLQNQRIQKVLQDQINKQTLKRVKQQRQKSLYGKQDLADEFNRKGLFNFQTYQKQIQKSKKLTELQNQLKKQMQLKWLREVHEDLLRKTNISDFQLQKLKEQQKLDKQMLNAERKIQMQKNFQLIQKEQRAKIKKQQLELDEKRKRQIQEEMHKAIQQQKKHLQTYSILQRLEVQEEMKVQMKQSMLNELKTSKREYYEEKKQVQHFKQGQNQFRQQVRLKLQKQYQIEQRLHRQKQRQQKQKRLQIIKEKFSSLDKSNDNKQENENKQIEEAKRTLAQLSESKVNRKIQQKQKIKLRQEFQLQLFAFMKPQNYSKDNQKGEFLIKDFRSTIDKPEHLQRMTQRQQILKQIPQKYHQQKQQIKQQNSKNQVVQGQLEQSKIFLEFNDHLQKDSDKFERFSSQKKQTSLLKKSVLPKQHNLDYQDEKLRIKLEMTVDEYIIYKKKKESLNSKRDVKQIKLSKIQRQQQLKRKEAPKNIGEFQLLPIVNQNQNLQKGLDFINQNKSISLIQHLKTSQNEEAQMMKISQQNSQLPQRNPDEEVMRLTVHSNLGSPHSNKFMTSDEQENSTKKIDQKKLKVIIQKKIQRKQQTEEVPISFPKKVKKQLIKQKAIMTFVKQKVISELQLQKFMKDHFKNISRLLKKLNLFKRDDLIKIILQDHKNVTILQSVKDGELIGLVFVAHNQNKKKLRSMNILHIASYDQQYLLQLLITTVKYIFSVDPCEEVTMSMFYDTAQEQQHSYVKKFEKLYDPHGAIFQKKIFNSQYQRKHVLRRMIGQVTEIRQQKNNDGELILGVDLIISQQYLGLQNYYEVSGINVGSFGIMAMYLAKYQKQEYLKAIISSQKNQITSDIKNLAKLSLDISKNLQKLTPVQEKQFPNVFELNLALHQQNLKQLKCLQSLQQKQIKTIWRTLNLSLQLPFSFISLQRRFKQDDDFYKCKYFKFKTNTKNKIFSLKSKVYNSQVTILPCKNSKYKIFILDSQQFDQLKTKTSLDIFMKLIFANVSSHKITQWESIWLPQFKAKNRNYSKQGQIFSIYSQIRSKICYYYQSYLQNSISSQVSHKDLFITPPFILGIMDAQMQLCSEGSPLFIQRINSSRLVDLKLIEKQIDTD